MSAGGSYFSNVIPRYLDPRKPPPQPQLPPKEKIPQSQQYAQVASRYLSPRRSATQATGNVSGKQQGGTSHRPISKESLFPKNAKLSHVHPRYLDPSNYVPSSNSPRRMVEKRHIEDRRELGWRTDLVIGAAKCFDDYRPLTEQRERGAPKLKRSYKNTPSMVSAYVKDDIPIRHHSMAHLHKEGGYDSRQVSPLRGASRTNSPTRPWSNAGWQGTTFQQRERQTTLCQRQYLMEKQHVEQNVMERSAARVKPEHVPRVATLSPGYRLQEIIKADRQESERRVHEHQGSPSRPVTPMRKQQGTPEASPVTNASTPDSDDVGGYSIEG